MKVIALPVPARKAPKPRRARSRATPGIYWERYNREPGRYRLVWEARVCPWGRGAKKSAEWVHPRTREVYVMTDPRYLGDTATAQANRAALCLVVAEALEWERANIRSQKPLAALSIAFLYDLCNAVESVDVEPRVLGRVLAYAIEIQAAYPDPTVDLAIRPIVQLCMQRAWTDDIRGYARSYLEPSRTAAIRPEPRVLLESLATSLLESPKRPRSSISWESMGIHILNHSRFLAWAKTDAIWNDADGNMQIGSLTYASQLSETTLRAFGNLTKVGSRSATSTRQIDHHAIRRWLMSLPSALRPNLSDQEIRRGLPNPKEQTGLNAVSTRRDGGEPVMYLPAQLRSILEAGIAIDSKRESQELDPTCSKALQYAGSGISLTLLFWCVFGSRVCETSFRDGAAPVLLSTAIDLVTAKTGKHRIIPADYAPNTFAALKAFHKFNAALKEAGLVYPNTRIFSFNPSFLGATSKSVVHLIPRMIELGAPGVGREKFTPKSLRSTVGSYLTVAAGISGSQATSYELAASVLGNTPAVLTKSYVADQVRARLLNAGVNLRAANIEELMQIDDLAAQIAASIDARTKLIPQAIKADEERKALAKANETARNKANWAEWKEWRAQRRG